jgi:hypothetical protein
MKQRKTKKTCKNNHIRRKFLGARLEFDGNENNEQRCCFRNGRLFTNADLDLAIALPFCWRIELKLKFKDGTGFVRIPEVQFDVSSAVRFNELKQVVDDYTTIAGLEMPGDYEFHSNTWKAQII